MAFATIHDCSWDSEVLASYRVNGYGLSSNKFANIKYYYYCIREHGGCGKVCAALLTLNYMMLIFIKKKFLSAYNEIIVRYVDRVFGAQIK